jgi:hypothetical protein
MINWLQKCSEAFSHSTRVRRLTFIGLALCCHLPLSSSNPVIRYSDTDPSPTCNTTYSLAKYWLSSLTLHSFTQWNISHISLYSPIKVDRIFGRTYRLSFQGWTVSHAWNHHETGSKCSHTKYECCRILELPLRSEDVCSSNIISGTDYSDWCFSRFFLCLSRKMLEKSFKKVTIAAVHIIATPYFNPNIWHFKLPRASSHRQF